MSGPANIKAIALAWLGQVHLLKQQIVLFFGTHAVVVSDIAQ